MSASAYLTAVLADTPAALWECQDASGSPQDSAGGGHHLTSVSGTVAYRDPGPFGSDYALRLQNGASAAVAFFDNTMNNMSCEAWFQVVAVPVGTNSDIFFNAQSDGHGSGVAGWSVEVQSDLKFRVVVQGVAGETASTNPLPAPSTAGRNKSLPLLGVGGGGTVAAWTMVNVVRDAGTWKYYVNGSLEGTHGTDTPNSLTGGDAAIGFQAINGDNRYAYVSYWTKALSATDVANHHTAAAS